MSKTGWAIVEYGGSWEDAWEHVVKVYLKKEKAEEIMNIMIEQLDKKEKRKEKCGECMSKHEPYLIESYEKFKTFKEHVPKWCDRSKFVWQKKSDGHEAVCKNDISEDYYLYKADGYMLKEFKVDIEE